MDSPIELEVENEFENRNVIGGLDRLILNIGLAVLAVVPTFIMITVMPWRAATLLSGDQPEGRKGAILGPGVFFVGALTASVLLTGLINPSDAATAAEAASDALSSDDQPASAGVRSRLMAAMIEGDVWKAASVLFPFFIVGCGIAAISSGIGSLMLRVSAWTLRAATGAGLYYLTTMIILILAITTIEDFILPEDPDSIQTAILGLSVLGLGVFMLPWQFFWFFKGYTNVRAHISGIHAITLSLTIFIGVMTTAFWLAAINGPPPSG